MPLSLDANMPSLLELDIERPAAAKVVRHVLRHVLLQLPKMRKIGPVEDQLREIEGLIHAGRLEVQFAQAQGGLSISWRLVGEPRWETIIAPLAKAA